MPHTRKTVAGIVIRNDQGLVMGVCVYLRENISDATTTEAYACL